MILPLLLIFLILVLAGCKREDFPALPGLPDDLRSIPDALEKLDLPDLSGVSLPSLDSLPGLKAPEGGIVYSGPTERSVNVGDTVPGTDIVLNAVEDGAAVFQIGEFTSPKKVGDSLDFDGAWPSLADTTYNVRYRVYLIGEDFVRLAGVQQLLIPEIAPAEGNLPDGGFDLRFPFVDGVNVGGDLIAGTTYGYLGRYERGAQIANMPENQYPYRAVGDSLVWEGTVRPGLGAQYDLRTLAYGSDSLRVGGTITLRLPGP